MVNVSTEDVPDVSDFDTLYKAAKKACSDEISSYCTCQIYTASHMLDNYFLPIIKLKQYKQEDRFEATYIQYELITGGRTEWQLRRSVR